MGFEQKEEQRKNEGGNDLNEQQVESIVTRVLAGEREKGQLSQEMGELRKGIKDANQGLAGLKRLFCTEDGKICFPTQIQLNAYMEKQGKTIEAVDAKLVAVVEKINNLKPPKAEGPEGLTPLEQMTEEKRKGSSEEQNKARDGEVDKIINWGGVTDNDMYRRISRSPKNVRSIAKKLDIREEVFNGMTDEERKKVVLFSCKDGICRPFREGMEKEEGVKFYLRDEQGKFEPVDQSESEKKADFFAT